MSEGVSQAEQQPLSTRLQDRCLELLEGRNEGMFFTPGEEGQPSILLTLSSEVPEGTNSSGVLHLTLGSDISSKHLEFTLDPNNPTSVGYKDLNSKPPGVLGRLFSRPKTTADARDLANLEEALKKAYPTPTELKKRQEEADSKKEAERLEQLKLKAAETARRLLEKWRNKTGPKGISIVVDDRADKRSMAAMDFDNHASRNIGHIYHEEQNGEEAIEVYRAIRQLADQDQPKIFLILDGDLGGKYSTGFEIADQIMQDTSENNWPNPFLVGFAMSRDRDMEIRNKFDDLFLYSAMNAHLNNHKNNRYKFRNLVEAIEAKISE